MTKRTCNIIKACKDWFNTGIENVLDRVKQYMSKECICPIEHYTDGIMDNIMFEAMCDYIDSCDRPSFFLREMDRIYNKENMSRAEQIALTFQLVEVMDDKKGKKFINGFKGVW